MASSESSGAAAASPVRCVLRRAPTTTPPWTPEEDALLERLAAEHASRGHWRRVASRLPGRSPRQCRDRWRDHLARDVYHRPFTAGDDADLARLYVRHAGRWRDMSRAVHQRTSRVLRRRWREIRYTDAVVSSLWRPRIIPTPPPDYVHDDRSSSQQPFVAAAASARASSPLALAAQPAGIFV